MPDITMCMNDDCSKKEKCYRYTAIPTPNWQSYSKFEEKDCNSFWDNTGKRNLKKRGKKMNMYYMKKTFRDGEFVSPFPPEEMSSGAPFIPMIIELSVEKDKLTLKNLIRYFRDENSLMLKIKREEKK